MFVRHQLALVEEGNGNTEEAKKLFAEVASFNFNSVGFALVQEDATTRANQKPLQTYIVIPFHFQ